MCSNSQTIDNYKHFSEFGFFKSLQKLTNHSNSHSFESNSETDRNKSNNSSNDPMVDKTHETESTSSENKRLFRKFSIENYRKALNAWKVQTVDGLAETETTAISDDQNIGRQTVDTIGDAMATESDQRLDKTIEMNDSFESIPETPETVKKRIQRQRTSRNRSKKSLVSSFIHFEAEVEMDSDFDDIEDTQREMYSQSLIDDMEVTDTQPVGQLINGIDSRNTTDMRAVYVRSVAEQLVGKTNKFKLQYNYDPTINVYSQQPTEEELRDYEFDSFCVPNDCLVFDESPEMAITSEESTPQVLETRKKSTKRRKFKRIIFSP